MLGFILTYQINYTIFYKRGLLVIKLKTLLSFIQIIKLIFFHFFSLNSKFKFFQKKVNMLPKQYNYKNLL